MKTFSNKYINGIGFTKKNLVKYKTSQKKASYDVEHFLYEQKLNLPKKFDLKDIKRFLADLSHNEINGLVDVILKNTQILKEKIKAIDFLCSEKFYLHDDTDIERENINIKKLELLCEAKYAYRLWKHNLSIIMMIIDAQFFYIKKK